MDIFESRKEGWLILELKGRMDAITSPLVREKIAFVIGQGETRILLDCLGLEYVSSAGFRILFEAAYNIQDLKGGIGCYGVNANVRKIFNMADLASEIPIFNTQEEALQG
jgi:anti-anti-sigma factor